MRNLSGWQRLGVVVSLVWALAAAALRLFSEWSAPGRSILNGNDQSLYGGRPYTLHVPKDAPVAQFSSFTVYDNESR
jgi:hypothetical protein